MVNFLNNPWAITIGGGIVVAIVIGLWKLFSPNRKQKNEAVRGAENTITNSPNITINNNVAPPRTPQLSKQEQIDLKARTKVLFVEDQTFKQFKNLKKAGWQVSQIKDVGSLDMPEVRDANIIFVDYKGVGKLSGDQGRGLVKQLKSHYGTSKWIVFYSAHPFTLDVHDIGADSFLSKESDFYEIERKVIEGARRVFYAQ